MQYRPHNWRIGWIACCALALTALSAGAASAAREVNDLQFFESRIRPLLAAKCQSCHGSEKSESDLRVDSRARLLSGGISGAAVVPGEPEKSLLLAAVRRDPEAGLAMPPDEKLTASEIADVETWIQRGAAWPDQPGVVGAAEESTPDPCEHWAFQPIRRPVPPVAGAGWAQTPIDAFVAAEHERRNLSAAPRADRERLIRRLTLDLTGLPPSPEEVHTFLGDQRPGGYQRLVERLLASPEYGRRYGRHWLDVVRYADTAGDNSDFPIPEAALYRDYVIDAFNNDLAFDQFLREQLAGDLLAREATSDEEFRRERIATTFVAMARRFGDDLNPNDVPLVLGNTIATVGQAMLGMTVECARCHDHKFDPIPTEDYYGLYGYFQSTRWPTPGREGRPYPIRFVSLQRDAAAQAEFERLNQRIADYRERHKRVPREVAKYLGLNRQAYELRLAVEQKLSADLPTEELQAELKSVEREIAAIDRDMRQGKGWESLKEYRALTAPLEAMSQRGELAYAVVDAAETGDARVQLRGQRKRLGKVAPRGFLSILAGDERPEIPAGGSGRLELAEWIASSENPLTARVAANRIWQWHFGQGLVDSPNNFGLQGSRPTHPELLDWLASELMDSGWSVKHLHRLIVNSATYQQASLPEASAPEADTDNRYYWQYQRRRLEAEAIRDSILAISGQLDLQTPSETGLPPLMARAYSQHKPFECQIDHNYRSVYLITSRIRKNRFLSLFDGADPSASTGKRRASTVPLQSLYLMNSEFLDRNAEAFATRLLSEREKQTERIELAWQLAYSRNPTAVEAREAGAWLDHRRLAVEGQAAERRQPTEKVWKSLCRVLLMSNELAFLD